MCLRDDLLVESDESVNGSFSDLQRRKVREKVITDKETHEHPVINGSLWEGRGGGRGEEGGGEGGGEGRRREEGGREGGREEEEEERAGRETRGGRRGKREKGG